MKNKFSFFLETHSTITSPTTLATAERVAIPTTITIGGQLISINENPELANLVALVRKDTAAVEKNKLYDNYKKLQEQINALPDPTTFQQPGNAVNVESIVTAISAQMDQKFNNLVNNFQATMSPLLKTSQDAETSRIQAYRNQLLADNQGQVVPDMVVGNSIEELDAALVMAKKGFESVRGMFGIETPNEIMSRQHAEAVATANAGQPVQTAPVTTVTPVATPVAPVQTAPTVLPSNVAVNTQVQDNGIPDIKSMSPEAYAANRETLLKQVQDTYAGY